MLNDFSIFMLTWCRSGSRAGLWGGLNCLFHVKSFLMLLFAIGNIAVWAPPAPAPAHTVSIVILLMI